MDGHLADTARPREARRVHRAGKRKDRRLGRMGARPRPPSSHQLSSFSDCL